MNWRRGSALAFSVVVMAVSTAWAGPVTAQTEGGNQEKIDSLKEHIHEASVEETRLLTEMEAAERRKGALDAKVGDLDRQIAAAQGGVDAAQDRLAAVEAERQATEARLVQTARELQAAKDQLGRQAISAYTGQTEAAQWAELILESRTIGDLAAKRTYIKAAAGSQAETIAAAARLKDEIESLRDELNTARAQAGAERDVVAAEQDRLENSRATQDGVRQEIAGEVATLDQTRDQIVDRKEEFEAEVRALERDSAAVAATLRQRQSSGSPAPTTGPGGGAGPGGSGAGGSGGGGGQSTGAPRRSGLVSPIPGAPVVSGYGQRVHPVYGTVRMHTGVDLGASSGTPIRAAGNGVVVTAGSMSGYGMTTVIDHGGGLATLYGHQSSIGVSEGQTVTQGQTIGRVGCTGTCTGPHLHYEVRINGSPVNPAPYL